MSARRKWWLPEPQYRTGKQRKYVDRIIEDEAVQGINDVILSWFTTTESVLQNWNEVYSYGSGLNREERRKIKDPKIKNVKLGDFL